MVFGQRMLLLMPDHTSFQRYIGRSPGHADRGCAACGMPPSRPAAAPRDGMPPTPFRVPIFLPMLALNRIPTERFSPSGPSPAPGGMKSAASEGGMLKVCVPNRPEKGKANKALVELLRQVARVEKVAIELIAGENVAPKRFLLRGVNPAEIAGRVEQFTKPFSPAACGCAAESPILSGFA